MEEILNRFVAWIRIKVKIHLKNETYLLRGRNLGATSDEVTICKDIIS